jgi:hypothetical protein
LIRTSEDRGSGEQRHFPFRLWDVVVLAAASFYAPFQTVAINPEGADLLTAMVFGVGILLVATSVLWIAVRVRLDATGASYAIATAFFLYTTMGPYLYRFPLNRIGILGTGLVLAAIVYRLRALKVVAIGVTWGVFFLVLAPAVTAATRMMAESAPVRMEISDVSHSVSSDRDVVVLVADAYPSAEVLSEFYDYDNSGFIESIRSMGFTAGDIHANYSLTTLSVPSVLQMDYVAGANDILTDSDTNALFEVLGGENVFATTLVDSGYRYIFVESGWLGTQCGASVDICVTPPWPGETFFDIGFRTILRDLPGFVTGTQFNRGAQNAIHWLESELPVYLHNGEKDYIYVHILVPHPPLFFKSDCSVERRADMGGFAITGPDVIGAGNDARRAAYLEQVECVNSVVLNTASRVVDASAVLVFFGDHGPDGTEQLYSHGDVWTEAQIAERFGTFSAVSVPDCPVEHPLSLVDLLPPVMECLGGPASTGREPLAFVVTPEEEGTRIVLTHIPKLSVGP